MRRRTGRSGALASLGPALVSAALADVGVTAPSARVDVYRTTVGAPDGSAWGAAALSTWIREAACAAGWSAPPVAGAVTPSDIVAQFETVGRWTPRSNLAATPTAGKITIAVGMVMARSNGTLGVLVAVGSTVSIVVPQSGTHVETHTATLTQLFADAGWLGVGTV